MYELPEKATPCRAGDFPYSDAEHLAIRNCQRLEIIRAAEGSQLREIATEAIAFCPALKTVYFSALASDVQIPAEFSRCPSLTSIRGPQ